MSSEEVKACSRCGTSEPMYPPDVRYCKAHRRSIRYERAVDWCGRCACNALERERLEAELRPRPPRPDQIRVTDGIDCERLDRMVIAPMKED